MAKRSIKKSMTKSELLSEIAGETGLTRKDVLAVLDTMKSIIARHISPRGAGEFSLPGLLKVRRVKVLARKARKNVPNPFRPGEFMDIPARRATSKIRISPLKGLKEML